MLPVETFETRKCLLTLSLEKARSSAEAVLQANELFIYEDIRYVNLQMALCYWLRKKRYCRI